jgi:hypothetical protein
MLFENFFKPNYDHNDNKFNSALLNIFFYNKYLIYKSNDNIPAPI